MTARAIAGLVVFNVLLLMLGVVALRSLRVWRAGADLVPLTGLAYMLGVGMLVVVGTTEIVIGVPIGPLPLILGCLVLLLAAESIVRARNRLAGAEPQARPLRVRLGATLSEHRLGAVGVAIGVVALSSYFVALFRAARVMPAHEWDGWWIWNLRAKAIYFDGNLGDAILAIGPPYSSYPPGLSILYASALEAMGDVDTVTLHLQNWFLGLGFAAALIGLLVGRVRAWIALPTVLLVVTLPGLRDEAPLFHADALLAYQVALAVVLLLLWLEDRAWWRSAAAGVLLSSALLTKRDGLLFVACVVVALVAASWLERRWAWPRVTLTAVGIAAVGSIWWIAYRPQLDEAAPSGGASALASDPGRFGAALRLTLDTALDPMSWSLLGGVAAVAVLLAVVARGGRIVTFAVVFMGLSLLGIAGAIAVERNFDISRDPILSPVDRLVLVPVVVLGAILPLLLETAWRSTVQDSERRDVAHVSPAARHLEPASRTG